MLDTSDRVCAPEGFLDGYVSCLLWCGVMVEDGSGEMSCDHNLGLEDLYNVDDLPEDVQSSIRADCDGFWAEYGARIEACEDASTRYPIEDQAGHDFYLTRNGHGAGFWDGDWPEPLASALTDGAKAYGSSGLMLWWGDDDAPEWDLHA